MRRCLGYRQRKILLMAYDRAQEGGEHAPRTGSVLVQQDIFKELYGWTGLGHMTVDTCGKQFLLILHMAFKAKKNSAEAPRLSKKSCSGNMALCRV